MNDEELDKKIAELMGPLPRRRRGRPRTGDAKAWEYTKQYEKFARDGMSPWRAIEATAKQHRKTPEHISKCRKHVYDNYGDYIDDDMYELHIVALAEQRTPEDD